MILRNTAPTRLVVVLVLVSLGFLLSLAAPRQATTTNSLPNGYHTADQIASALGSIASSNPTIASVHSIGPTWATTQGQANRQILALRLCHLCDGTARPSVVFIGGQHAREISTSEILLDFANDLVARWPSDPDISYLINSSIVWIIPLTNPDGHVQVETGLANWRKNVDSTQNAPGDSSLTLPDGIGVDPNRNFSFHWGEGGASATPGAYNYQGPAAASEPETRALQNFLTSTHPAVLVDYHSPLATVIWPWGYQATPAADALILGAAGHRLAEIPVYGAGQTNSAVGPTTGDTIDWSYGTLGTIALGVEVDGGFAPDISTVGTIWTKNRTGMLDAIRWTLDPSRARGPAIDAISATPSLACGPSAPTVTIQATLSTTHAGNNPIVAARFAVDNPDPIDNGQAMSVVTGASVGTAIATLSITPAPGRYVAYVVGEDNTSQWGVVVATAYVDGPNCVFLPSVANP